MQQGAAASELLQPLSEIRALIETTIRSIRSLTFDLASPVLYEVGLEAAIESLADQLQERHRVRCHFQDDGQQKPTGGELQVVLYHAVRELLANVAKHAHATSVHVSVRRDGDSLRIRVEDDGVGFEIPAAGFHVSRSGGFGLFHAAECLKHLGGRLQVDSAPGRGTTVTLGAPLAAASSTHEAQPG